MGIKIPHRSTAQYKLAEHIYKNGPQTKGACLTFLDSCFRREQSAYAVKKMIEYGHIIQKGEEWDLCLRWKDYLVGCEKIDEEPLPIVPPREVREPGTLNQAYLDAMQRALHFEDGREPMRFISMGGLLGYMPER